MKGAELLRGGYLDVNFCRMCARSSRRARRFFPGWTAREPAVAARRVVRSWRRRWNYAWRKPWLRLGPPAAITSTITQR
jgi:hypothetical protein